MLAKGMGGRVALIDTEHGSGDLYAHLFDYDILRLEPPYSPARYIEALEAAAAAGYASVILDSLSHAWSGEGGVLDMKDAAAKTSRSGNDFAAWRNVTPQHNKLVDALLSCPIHLIATMRTKTAYEIVENDSGKKTPTKIGLAPVQRDGMEYEFTVVLDLSVEGHIATSSKDRTGLFDGQNIMLTEKVGQNLKTWLEAGVDAPPPEPKVSNYEAYRDGIDKAGKKGTLADLQKVWAMVYKDATLTQNERDTLEVQKNDMKELIAQRSQAGAA
jgi:hypothetical protein